MVEHDPTEELTPTGRKKAPIKSGSRKRQIENNAAHLATVGRMLSDMPMTAEELIAKWEIPTDAAYEVMVKIQKVEPTTGEMCLIDEVILAEYSGKEMARRFGPGTYYLRPPAGQWSRKSAKIPVSPSYATVCGWGKLAPSAADALAMRTLDAAQRGPTDPVDLLAAIERMMDRKLAEAGVQRGPMVQGPAGSVVDPAQLLQAQFGQVERTMELMSRLEQRAIETVERRMGLKPKEDEEGPAGGETFWEKLILGALPMLQKMMESRQDQPPIQARPQAPPPPPPAPTLQGPSAPVPQQEAHMPTLTPEEQSALAPVISMLRPFAGHLVDVGKRATVYQAARELAPLIPPALYPNLDATAEIVRTKGAAVLGAIHPDLATEQWGKILDEIMVELSKDNEP